MSSYCCITKGAEQGGLWPVLYVQSTESPTSWIAWFGLFEDDLDDDCDFFTVPPVVLYRGTIGFLFDFNNVELIKYDAPVGYPQKVLVYDYGSTECACGDGIECACCAEAIPCALNLSMEMDDCACAGSPVLDTLVDAGSCTWGQTTNAFAFCGFSSVHIQMDCSGDCSRSGVVVKAIVDGFSYHVAPDVVSTCGPFSFSGSVSLSDSTPDTCILYVDISE